MAGLIVLGVLLAILILGGLFTVEQQTVAVVERLGKFKRISPAGLNFKIPLIEQVSGRISLKVQQLNVTVETKTQDNVFVKIMVAVQFHVLTDKVFDAFYRLSDPAAQIQSFVFDVVRAQVPKMQLDGLFENKDAVANVVKEELSETMTGFGYYIVKSLVTDIDPDEKVKNAMNEINEQKRLRMAAQERGEAEKILKVKQAEAEAESMRLSGQGVADQRRAIIDGLKESIEEFQQGVPDSSAKDVMSLVLMTQYYDTLKEIGAKDKSTTILLPHNPSGLHDLASQMRDGVITGNLTAQTTQ